MDRKWMLDFSGCDGGTIGSSEKQSIWVCGIEWGGGFDTKDLEDYINQTWEGSPDFGYQSIEDSDFYPYNRVLFKLLTVMQGNVIDSYKDFAKNEQPFVENSHSSYFKMNLYPIAFSSTDHTHWMKDFSEITGFENKQKYLDWCHNNRFPVMQQWVQKYTPKLIICFGKGYTYDFNLALADNNRTFTNEIVGDLVLQWKKNDNGTIIAILPFPNAPNKGLKSHSDIEAMGQRLAELID